MAFYILKRHWVHRLSCPGLDVQELRSYAYMSMLIKALPTQALYRFLIQSGESHEVRNNKPLLLSQNRGDVSNIW